MNKLYTPFGIVVSIVGGIVAKKAFNAIWAKTAGQDEAPKPRDPDSSWKQVAAAAVLQGAVVGGVKAMTNRAGAAGYAKATGTWPA